MNECRNDGDGGVQGNCGVIVLLCNVVVVEIVTVALVVVVVLVGILFVQVVVGNGAVSASDIV